MNETNTNQQIYAYLEQSNEQQSRNTYSKEINEQQSRNDKGDDNDVTNPKGSYQLNFFVPKSRSEKRLSKKKRLYLDFLQEGLSPDEAIKKVREHKKLLKKPVEESFEAQDSRELSLSAACNSTDTDDFATDPNLQLSEKDLFKEANRSNRLLRDCKNYCQFYNFKGKTQILFKFLFHEQRLPLETALKKTLQLAKKKIHKGMDKDPLGRDLVNFCLRNNFKGAPKQWFLRLVRVDGYEPEEAKNIVLKQIQDTASFAQKRNSSNWNNTDGDFNTTSQLSNDNTNVSPIADCGDLQVRVALLPKDYPQQKLGQDALRLLEDAVIEEVARGWEVNLLFKSINYGDGMLLVDCGNTETGQWLIFVTPQLNAWSGIEIEACMEDDLPMPHTVSVCLPNGAGQNITTTLTLLNSQNAGLNTKLWKLLDFRESNKDQLLMFGIDQGSFETISATGNIIYYGFGSVSVQLK